VLEHHAYSNMGPVAFRPLPKHGFVYARLVPIRPVSDAWLVSGSMRASWAAGSPPLVHKSGKERPGLCSDSTDAGPMRLLSGSPMTSSVLPS